MVAHRVEHAVEHLPPSPDLVGFFAERTCSMQATAALDTEHWRPGCIVSTLLGETVADGRTMNMKKMMRVYK